MELLTMTGVAALLVMLTFTAGDLFILDPARRFAIASGICIVLTVALFASPCLEALSAIRTRDASALCLPLITAGLVCSSFWTIYGFTFGIIAIWAPNGAGAALSAFSICVKLCVGYRNVNVGSRNAATNSRAVLNAALLAGKSISLVPMDAQDTQLHVQPVSSLNTDTLLPVVQSQSGGSFWKVERVDSRYVALRTCDHFYLRICLHERMESSASESIPTGYVVVASAGEEPTEAGWFLPVDAPMTYFDEGHATHRYLHDSLAFWNPLYRVFIRVNELGVADCSSVCNPVGGDVTIPAGWGWERFLVQESVTDGNASENGLRHRRHESNDPAYPPDIIGGALAVTIMGA
jgi:hypothetical protein